MRMKAVFSITLVSLAILWVSSANVLAQPLLPEEQGSLSDVIDKFRLGIIPRDSGKYVVPSDSDLRSVEAAYSLLLAWMNTDSSEKLLGAITALAEINFVVVRFADSMTGRMLFIVREASGYNRGWGLYILQLRAPRSYRNLLIEVPHIGFDEFTEIIGTKSFVQSYAAFLLVAGAHRYANPNAVADVAHTEQCVFHVVHRVLSTNASTTIQVHGFAETSAGREQYPQIVLSSGIAEGSEAVAKMSAALVQNGLTVGVFDGTKYKDLGATTNVQGSYARGVGANFVHMEIARTVRKSDELGEKVAKSVERFAEEVVINIPEVQSPALMILVTTLVSLAILKIHRGPKILGRLSLDCDRTG